jgi:hypothetical protein
MRDLVFVKCNSRLIQKKANKRRDPIEKEVDDVLNDDDNEFITGIVPTAESEETEVVQPQDSEQVQASQGGVNGTGSHTTCPACALKSQKLQNVQMSHITLLPCAR